MVSGVRPLSESVPTSRWDAGGPLSGTKLWPSTGSCSNAAQRATFGTPVPAIR
jgi:hypothetical protein